MLCKVVQSYYKYLMPVSFNRFKLQNAPNKRKTGSEQNEFDLEAVMPDARNKWENTMLRIQIK